ncbi:hypothetical protein OH77DRAFT_1499188 [Trametes cingulata]|nr:hypothetical protein OH77DRAFT_1499188 [Trametes cingulata]
MTYDESNSRLVIIEDRDKAVQYEGDWLPTTIFGETLSVSGAEASSVSLEFDGTRIIVIALALPVFDYEYANVPVVQFAIDSVVADVVTAPAFANYTFYRVFERQGLSEGTHTINVTVLDATDDYPFLLDYFMFQPSKKYGDLAFAPSTLEVQRGSTAGSSTGPPVGAIVGGVLGGLGLIGLVIGLFFWWRRRRQHAYTSLEGEAEPKSARTVTPFTSTRPSSTMSAADSKRASFNPSSAPNPSTLSASTSTSNSPGGSSTTPQSPSEYSSTGATVASSSAIPSDSHVGAVPGSAGYEIREAPHLHSMHGRVGLADAASRPPAPRKGRRPSMAGLVQAAVQAARGATRRDDVTPSEAPPRYSER